MSSFATSTIWLLSILRDRLPVRIMLTSWHRKFILIVDIVYDYWLETVFCTTKSRAWEARRLLRSYNDFICMSEICDIVWSNLYENEQDVSMQCPSFQVPCGVREPQYWSESPLIWLLSFHLSAALLWRIPAFAVLLGRYISAACSDFRGLNSSGQEIQILLNVHFNSQGSSKCTMPTLLLKELIPACRVPFSLTSVSR